MSDERSQVLDRIEDAIGALVNQRHGPGRLIGAWEADRGLGDHD